MLDTYVILLKVWITLQFFYQYPLVEYSSHIPPYNLKLTLFFIFTILFILVSCQNGNITMRVSPASDIKELEVMRVSVN